MKNLYTIIILIWLTSCSEDFIDIPPISEQSTENFFKSTSDIEQAVTAAYDALQPLYDGNSLDHFAEVRSDNSYNDNTTQSGGARASFDNFNLASSNFMLNEAWINSYLGIQRCNIVLNRIDAIEGLDESIKSIRKGEMLFLRSLHYFNIVRIWGDAPLVINETIDPLDGFDQTRNSSMEIYAQIISDLQQAVDVLPSKTNTSNGRATIGAARTLLAKVYLTTNEFTQASALLEEIINSSEYGLLTNFSDVFDVANENNLESIFEVQFKSGTNGEGSNVLNPSQNSDINNRPSPNLITLFNGNQDNRYDATIDTTDIGLLYNAKRLDVRGDDSTFGFNTMVYRYGDVLLMAAESLNEIAYNSGDAFEYINLIRNRAGAVPYTTAELRTQQEFREAIAKERRLELAFENHRWFDLIRTNKAIEVMSAANGGSSDASGGSALPFTISEFQLLFPIPLAQIDVSGGALTQNQGY